MAARVPGVVGGAPKELNIAKQRWGRNGPLAAVAKERNTSLTLKARCITASESAVMGGRIITFADLFYAMLDAKIKTCVGEVWD